MKITNEQLQKIIHEELQEAARKGEMTEQELKQIEEASIKNWFKDVGKAIGTAGSVGMRKYRKERAKTAEKEKAAKAAGGVDPNRLTPQLTRQILDKPDAKQPTAPATATPPASVPSDTAPAADSSVVAPNQAKSIKQIADYKNFKKALNSLNTTISNNKNLDPKELEGIVFTVDPTRRIIVPLPAVDKRAKVAIQNAIEKVRQAATDRESTQQPPKQPEQPASGDSPTTGVRGIEGYFQESKNPSYQETYNKWQKLIKG